MYLSKEKDINNIDNTRAFTFDIVFGPDVAQEQVYVETAKPLVERFISGFNATIFA